MFAERLKALRVENNFTQKQIADILGVDRSTYAYYELSRTRPDIETLVVLAKLFNVTTDYMLTGENSLPASGTLKEESAAYNRGRVEFDHLGDLAKDERELILYYRMLNSPSKSATLAFAKERYSEVAEQYHALIKE